MCVMPSLFSNQMVLQQNTNNAVWGFADPGEHSLHHAELGEVRSKTTANPAGGPMASLSENTLARNRSFTCPSVEKTPYALTDVAIGEVWLCAGQSNMGWALGNCFDAEQRSGKTCQSLPTCRIFKSSREHWHEPLNESRDRLSKWVACTPETAAMTSAVSYHFGKTLQETLGSPCGNHRASLRGNTNRRLDAHRNSSR